MALKPTIYKFAIAVSDLDRNYYDALNLTIAQHPSETLERMLVRVLAFCFNAQPRLEFCKGLSATEEPDLWAHTLDGSIELWIDVGEPAVDRIKKASHIASAVRIYCFNTKSGTWWEQNRSKFAPLSVAVFRLQWEQVQALAQLVERTMEIAITITDGSAYVTTALGDCELSLQVLQETGQ